MSDIAFRKKLNRGFTLLEILIALVVIGILAAIAIPTYQDYVTRSRVAEAVTFADAERIKVILKRMDASGNSPTAFSEPKVDMTSLQWVPLVQSNPVGDTVIGYILTTMDLPGLGLRDTFALEYLYNGSWRCVNAADAKDRSSVSANKALEDKYLPVSCHAGASLMTQHPHAPQGCPPGTQKAQVADANGKVQQVCQRPKTQAQTSVQPLVPTANKAPSGPAPITKCPGTLKLGSDGRCHTHTSAHPPVPTANQASSGPAPITKCPGTLKLGSDGRCHTSNAPLPSQCPVGQDCGHHDPKCPVGHEYIGQTSVAVRDHHNPFGSTNNYATKTTIVQAQCVAKCKDGFVFNPNEPSKCAIAPSTNNHTCRGPKFICERSHVTTGAGCTVDAPYAANFIENLKDGSRYVTRGCITQQEAFEADKYNKNHNECKNYNVVVLQDAHFKCTFPCYGDACNLESVPDHPATWSSGKSATDLPDQFDKP